MKTKHLFFALFACGALSTACGQQLDASFHSPLPIRAAYITVIAVQPDGKILLGGDINFYGTEPVHNLIRIQADGSLDESFTFSMQEGYVITHVELLPSGEMIALARSYDSYNSVIYTPGKIIKINPDGSVSKEITVEQNGQAFTVDDSGKVLIGFETLRRYNDDLTPDTDFNNNFSSDGGIRAIAITGDKILVAGPFSEVNGVAKNDIAKLNDDGTLDNSFDTGTGTQDYIGALTVQPDGKILLGECYINSFNGVTGRGMMRLHEDGAVDTDFQPPVLNGGVSKAVVTDEGIYAAAFLQMAGEARDRMFRVDAGNGDLDPGFPPVQLDEFGSFTIRMGISNGQFLVNNTQAYGNVFGLSKIDTNGTYDDTFAPEISRYGTIKVADIFQGKMLVAGDFIRMSGIETYGIARLSPDGAVDETFRLKQNKGIVYQVKVLDDDNLLVTTYKNFFKLDGAGDQNSEFSWNPFKLQYQVIKFRVLPDGKIMTADPNLIYRLNADGTEDPSFDIEDISCFRSTKFDFDMQGDKVIYGSQFCAIGAVSVNRLARLTTQADVDLTFDPGEGPNNNVSLIKVLHNNEVIVGGFFDEFDGHHVNFSLVKLSPDGEFDETFNDNLQRNPAVAWDLLFSRKVEQLGSTIYFQHMNGIAAIGVDGNVDTDFNIPAVVSVVSDIITLSDNHEGGRTKHETGLIYSVGRFKLNNTNSPSFVLKMLVELDPGEIPDVPTGLEKSAGQLNDFQIEIFPHPVQDKLNIKIQEPAGNFNVEIFDLTGKKFVETNIALADINDPPQIDVQHTPPGFYLLKLRTDKGREAFAKFVKVK